MESQPQVVDDGLVCPPVGPWSEEKCELIHYYASLFATGMKKNWDTRVYVELYSAAGYSRIRNTDRIVMGSPLLALTVSDPFDKYIFCEAVPEKLAALRARASRISPGANIAYISGDCDSKVQEILDEIPKGTAVNSVLTLCVVDPFDIGIQFETLRKLSAGRVDFLCLLALHMDANRAYSWYIQEHSTKIGEFLGTTTWRDDWAVAQHQGVEFPKFLAEKFSDRMASIGYLPQPMHQMKQIRRYDKNVRLYCLALFSKHQLAYQFWEKVLKGATDQRSLF
jgi:three-Cys-motif partner protein